MGLHRPVLYRLNITNPKKEICISFLFYNKYIVNLVPYFTAKVFNLNSCWERIATKKQLFRAKPGRP